MAWVLVWYLVYVTTTMATTFWVLDYNGLLSTCFYFILSVIKDFVDEN